MRDLWWCVLGGAAWCVTFSLIFGPHIPQPWSLGLGVVAGVAGMFITALAIEAWRRYDG